MYIHAATKAAADAWARNHLGLRPKDFRAYGDRSAPALDGMKYHPGDRVIVLDQIGSRIERLIERNLRRAWRNPPTVEHVSVPTPA